ncbi:uncharacterized protein KY384_009196 [Bacidia gigantensis]|uniref:uncharacterized protein n=1 Tax=Bacidia gigantensis TaxID=2732470 RepID=UPI001D03E89D|nr:uncharacterized protein KY384_009196 [Bacidia gigantensis]KAG8525552.1 hypothetical protein KY384_009196 [Bacidia gigantensis]
MLTKTLASAILATLAAMAQGVPQSTPSSAVSAPYITPAVGATVIPTKEQAASPKPLDGASVNLFVCQDKDFSGPCQALSSPSGLCLNLGNGFDDSISSLGPDRGSCNVFNDINCKTGSGFINNIVNPGINDLGDGEWDFNDRISSYVCFA